MAKDMNLTRLCSSVALFLCAALAPIAARADIVPVTNASFETLPLGGLGTPCGTGCSYNVGAVSGWTVTGASQMGQFQPGPPTTGYFDYVPDGLTVAYSNGGVISQTVVPTVQVGELYTLTVAIGNRKDAVYSLGTADLLINSHQYFATGVPAVQGAWTTWTATYVGSVADAGQNITIQLNAAAQQGDYDNVQLSVPEPDAMTLLGVMGGALLAVTSIIKRKKA